MTEPAFKNWLIGWRGRRAFVIATTAAMAKRAQSGRTIRVSVSEGTRSCANPAMNAPNPANQIVHTRAMSACLWGSRTRSLATAHVTRVNHTAMANGASTTRGSTSSPRLLSAIDTTG